MKHLSPDLLAALADGQRPAVADAAHLAGCPDCRGELAELRSLAQGLADMPAPPAALRAETLRRLGLAPRPRPALRAWAWGPVLAAGLALFWVLPMFQQPRSIPVSGPASTRVLPAGQSAAQARPSAPASFPAPILAHASAPVRQRAAIPEIGPVSPVQAPAAAPEIAKAVAVPTVGGALVAPAQTEAPAAVGSQESVSTAELGQTKVSEAPEALGAQTPALPAVSIESVHNNLLQPGRGEQLSFSVSLTQACQLTVLAVDSRGHTVATLFDAPAGPGNVDLSWDGGDARGAYTIVARAGTASTNLKVLVVR
jgi:hypothetical protein